MKNYLDVILRHKRSEVEEQRRATPVEHLRDREGYAQPRRSLVGALRRHRPAIIAEIKAASPSKGILRTGMDVAGIAASYVDGGAAALSVLTDKKYFGGQLDYLPIARRGHVLPVLRKDFIIDPYQVYQARAYEADAILLIAAALEKSQLSNLNQLARELGLEVLMEVHSERDIAMLDGEPVELLGINNRDLSSFQTDITTSIRLRPMAPAGSLIVSESGIQTRDHLTRLSACGIHAFLVGEALLRAPDPGQALRTLLMPAPGEPT